VANHQLSIERISQIDQASAFFQCGRYGFLDQHMRACPQGGRDRFFVQGSRHCHCNCLGALSLQHFSVIIVSGCLETGGDSRRGFFASIRHGRQLRAR
jgi:hypothetical protein